jgi:hypothetical protein
MSEPSTARVTIFGYLAAVALAPLVLVASSYLEFKTTGTHKIEDACRAIHIHEPIRRALRTIF